ncbi:MAG TPA: hypothetical protein VEK07_00800 [Polyangiaceae bacterium]|nr:hypothetical protein [Polyangiaceae bacterium]
MLIVVVVHVMFDCAHACPGAQAGAPHASTESGWQTMPSPQSESVVQGPGSHALTTWGWQAGCTQSVPASPGVHAAMRGHPEMPVIWQMKPFPQSLSVVQAVSAFATTGVTMVVARASRATEPRSQ